MKAVPLDESVALKARPAWVRAEGVSVYVSYADAAHLSGVGGVMVTRHEAEPWPITLERLALELEAKGLYLAGSPRAKKRRPKMLLVISKHDAERIGVKPQEVA